MKSTAQSARWVRLVTLVLGAVTANVAVAATSELVSSCENCHGVDGISEKAEIPTIGGLSSTYIVDSFAAYTDEARPCEEVEFVAGPRKGEVSDMCKAVGALSEAETQEIADHFAAKPFVPAKQTFDAQLAKQGKDVHALQCVKCHEAGGSSPDDDAGILAGQWMHYLAEQFEHFADGTRAQAKKMKVKMDKLTEADVKALVHYYGSHQ